LPTLADKGYRGAGIGVHSPVKGHNLHVSNASYNMLLTALRAIGERANAELKQRWNAHAESACHQERIVHPAAP